MSLDNMVALTTCSIRMHFASKDTDHALQLLLSVRGNIQGKPGCRDCWVGINADDAGLVHYDEEWDSAEAFHQHLQSEEFRRVLIASDLCCEEPRIVVGNLTGRIGMAYLRKLREEGDETQTV